MGALKGLLRSLGLPKRDRQPSSCLQREGLDLDIRGTEVEVRGPVDILLMKTREQYPSSAGRRTRVPRQGEAKESIHTNSRVQKVCVFLHICRQRCPQEIMYIITLACSRLNETI